MRCFLFWTLTVLTAVNVFAKTPDADELHRRVKRSGGEVIIQRIPSVSAKRNYCVPASVDMVLRYYDTRVGQRTLGKLFDSSKKNGTYSRNIVKEFGKGELSGFRCEIVYGMLQQELERLIELYTNSPELKRSVRKKFKNARINKRINGTGSRFPAMLNSAVCHHGRPKPHPSGIEPRHSMIGSMEQKNTHSSLPTVSRKNCSIASTI